MVRCLDIIEDYLVYRKYPFERLDGRIRGNLRQAAIDRFCKPDSDRFVFLLCTKAGGLGINLTAADTVIIYDSDWNPQNDLQAQARCHRIGQQKMVKVYRLLCRNTYEREMFNKASLKLGLDKAILQSMNTAQGKDLNNKQLTKKEIEDLLKKGAYGAVMEEDNAGDKFCEEDIDQILKRRTQVITLESEKGSTFSKASFASSGIRQDIDIDDPDFWKKWARKADIDTSEGGDQNDLVISEPRRRTQIKRYGHDEAVMDMSELESSGSADSDVDNSLGVGRGRGRRTRKSKKLRTKFIPDDYVPKDGEVAYGCWTRSECFKVERGILTFGWSRWPEIIQHNDFREGWKESDVEDLARIVILYCLRFYRGDEKIRSFIWDLITPDNISTDDSPSHGGQNSRGSKKNRKPKQKDFNSTQLIDEEHWSRNNKYDGDLFLESNYRKHLSRHANKVLLRIRMLYYIKSDIVGEFAQQVAEGVHVSALPINTPICDLTPAPWWDRDADRSLLVGTYKHGFESYNQMRSDPALSFLAKCGPPTLEEKETAITKFNDVEEGAELPLNSEEVSSEPPTPLATEDNALSIAPPTPTSTTDEYIWPSIGDLNNRVRRLISTCQRNFKKEEQKLVQKAKLGESTCAATSGTAQLSGDVASLLGTGQPGWDWQQLAMYLWKVERREKYEQFVRERERQRLEISQKKWTRKEEQEFYRAVTAYGVDYDRVSKTYNWTKFKSVARLEKKYDDTLTEYFRSFYAMCKRLCGQTLTEEEELCDFPMEMINEERARRALDRINLIVKIREETLNHPRLDERLKGCQISADVPDWWQPGKHDKDLLIGVSKHGLGRTDFYILNDPELSFREIVQKSLLSAVSGSFTTEMLEAAKLETTKTEAAKLDTTKMDAAKLDATKVEAAKLDAAKTETTKTDAKLDVDKTDAKIDVVKTESVKIESTIEIINSEVPKSETSKTEKIDSEIKIESVELQETEEEEKVETNESTSDKIESTKTEVITTDTNGDVENNSNEKEEIPSNEEPKEQMDVDNEENKIPDISDNNCEVEKVSDIPAEQINDKSSDEIADQQNEIEKSENTMSVENKETEVKEKDESPKNEEENIVKIDDVESKIETNKIVTDEALSDTNSKSDTKITEPTLKSKECASSVESVDRLKAMFPELEVVHKDVASPTIDKLPAHKPLQQIDQTIAHLLATSYQNPIKWPKEHALVVRLQHIVECVETGEWPVSKKFSAYAQNPTICGMGLEETDITVSKRDVGVSHDHLSLSDIHNEHSSLKANNIMAHSNPNLKRKRHIAIDVETERAKLHALLNTNSIPAHPIKHSPAPMWEQTDESLSEDSRRSTPVTPQLIQPPPAHQQSHNTPSRLMNMGYDLKVLNNPKPPTTVAATTQSTGPMDLSSGGGTQAGCMDLSSGPRTPSVSINEAQDFSMPFKNKPVQNITQTPTPPKSKLDDMLNKLMQKKNCVRTPRAADEPVVGKEMKRRKLDEIVFGLSAAKEQQSGPSSEQKKHLASTSTSHNYPTPSNKSQQNMTQQIGAAHRQSSKLDPLAAYLSSQVHEQQTSLLKQHTTLQQQLAQQQQVLKMSQASSVSSVSQTQRKMYEAMMDSMAKSTAEYSGKLNASSFSQESKVNKWLAEQNALMTDQQMSADFLSVPRRRRPRVDPTLLDWKKLTGEENVSVINRTTGKKLTGTKAPQLKRIGQWLLENPAYDVDPKWADLVKERGNLTHDLQKRLPQTERKKGPGRPPMQTGENPSSQSLSSNQPSTSMAPNLSFPSLASAGLGGLNPSTLLSSLSMGNFDPKNNPLLMPFSGLPNIGALGGMGGLSNMNLTNSLFANLAGLGLPGLAGMDPSSMNDNSHSTQSPQSNSKSSKSRKSDSNTKNIPSSSANVPSSMPGSLPFFFPNPSLLYTPLGLGGLNPFSLQPGAISSAYDSLSLLNGSLNVSSPNTSQNSLSRHKTSSSRGQNSNVSTVTSSSQRQPRTSTHHLPSPTQSSTDLLENLTRAGRNLPPPDLSKNRNSRDVDNLRSLMSSMPPFNVLAAGALASGSDSKKTREQEMREALENLSKASPELFARSLPDDKKFSFPSMEMIEKTLKRPAEQNTSNERPNKRAKDMISPITIPVPPTITKLPSTNRENLSESGIDLSGTIKAKSPEKQREKLKKMDIPQPTNVDVECDSQLLDKCDAESIDMTKQKSDIVDENDEKNGGKNRKRCRTKKTSVDENVERKNLRSNAGRAAAAAAARTKSHSPSPSPE